MSEWQPIETRENGGEILAFVPSYYQGNGAVIVAQWCDWHDSGCGWYDNRAFLTDPTHWQPLPEPPP